LLKNGNIDKERLEMDKNILYGLGIGKNDNETIMYTRFGNGIPFNINQNLMYMNAINYYQYPNNQIMMIGNNLNMRNDRKGNNNNLIPTNKVA
jgi:hypothetical protein